MSFRHVENPSGPIFAHMTLILMMFSALPVVQSNRLPPPPCRRDRCPRWPFGRPSCFIPSIGHGNGSLLMVNFSNWIKNRGKSWLGPSRCPAYVAVQTEGSGSSGLLVIALWPTHVRIPPSTHRWIIPRPPKETHMFGKQCNKHLH